MRIIVLGAGAGGGFPQWNCNTEHCRLARSGSARAFSRTQSSVAVTADDENFILLNCSPDLRQQINQTESAISSRRAEKHSNQGCAADQR